VINWMLKSKAHTSYQLKYSSYSAFRQKHFGEKAKGNRIKLTLLWVAKSFPRTSVHM